MPTFAVDVEKEMAYVCEEDRGLEVGAHGRPVFYIKGLTPELAAEVDDSLAESISERGRRKKKTKESTMKWKLGTTIIKILDYGLVRWENMRTRDGQEITWDPHKRSKMYSYIPESRRGEIADAIRNISELSEDEAENLELVQPS